jgi:O-antigen/teichoic acid export membrane protein
MNLGGWIKHFLIYGAGVILMRALPVLLIPIYTYAVTPEQYGVVELLNKSQDLMIVVFSLGLGSTLLTLYQMEQENTERRQALYSTAILLLLVTTLVLVSGLAMLSRPISTALFGREDFNGYVLLILAATYFETLFQIAVLYLQSELKSTFYVVTFSARALFSILVNLILVSWLKLGLKGILWAMVIHTATASVIVTVYVLTKTGSTFRYAMLPDMLRFGIPLVPASIMMFVLNNGDRYFLNAYTTREEVGIYGLGYRLAMSVYSMAMIPFGRIWSVVMVKIARDKEGPTHLGRIATYLVAILTFLTLCSSLFSPYVIRLLASPQYYRAYTVVGLIGASYLIYAWTMVMDASFYVTKRTGYKPLILGISGIWILFLYRVLIPRHGMVGAAWATLIGFAGFALVTLPFAQHVFRIEYEWSRLAKLAALGLVAYLLGAYFDPGKALAIVPRLAGVGIFLALICSNGISRPDERQYVRQQANQLWRKIGRKAECLTAEA